LNLLVRIKFLHLFLYTVDSRYLEFDGTMEKIWVNRSSTQEELRKYWKCVVCLKTKGRQLEQNFEELKPASHVPILVMILNWFNVFVAVFFSLLNSLNLVERLITSRYLFLCVWLLFICFVYVFQLLHCH
jgi:hypothetical protein